MSDTLLANPLVRRYLRQLDEACTGLPYAQAQELVEQITGHLEDALPPDAADADVKAELARLGIPRSLAAEAAGITPARFPHLQPALRKAGRRLARVRWWTWAVIAVLVPALGTGAGFLISMETTTPLSVAGTGWLYPVDQAHRTDVSVDGATGTISQTTVPIRSGQRQGIDIGVTNNSDWTQQILGTDPGWDGGFFKDVQVAVETGPYMHDNGAARHGTPIYYEAGVAIPPHSYRLVHVSWTADGCGLRNASTSFSDLPLTVHVGTVTRTENVDLDGQTFVLQSPTHAKCG
jgi:hypothetical protein